MRRAPGWEGRLLQTLERHRAAAFEWGVYDCATLVRETALALGAPDPFQGMFWNTKWACIEHLHAENVRSVRDFIVANLTPVPVAAAQRGDVGFTADRHPLMCPAVVIGAEAVSRDEQSWVIVPRALLVECFSLLPHP